ncbi:MAG: hypothetical protein ACRD0P_08030, partial [Stackebrandtia sp.]
MYPYSEIIAAAESAGPARPAIDREGLRAAAGRGELAELLAELRDDARRTDPLPELPYRLFRTYIHSGDRGQYEGRYFERRRRLNSAALIALIDGGAENLERLLDILWTICDEYSWA